MTASSRTRARSARVPSVAAAIAAAITIATPTLAHAQTWRTAELSRQVRDTAEHRINVAYSLGRFELQPGDAPLLYDARVRYDESRAAPFVAFEPAEREVDLGVRQRDQELSGKHAPGEMRLVLSRQVPLHLELTVGAGDTELELGGLALRELDVDASASRAALAFHEPNRTMMRSLEVHARAASVTASRLGNANAAEMRFSTGVGNLELDFGGRWSRDVEAAVDVSLGRVRIAVPAAVGVRVELTRVLARFEHPGFERQGDAWVSGNWASAAHKLTLRIDTTFGTVEILRTEPGN